MKRNQTGFALVELLLIILILAVVGFGGYYVWHSQREDNKPKSSTANTLKTSSSTKSADQTDSANYLVIKEWDVRAPYSGTQDLEYTIADNDKLAQITSEQLLAADPACKTAGSIVRALPNDPVGPLDSAAKDMAAQGATYAFVNGYYYFFQHDQSACSDNENAASLQTQNNDTVQALVPKLQAIPQ